MENTENVFAWYSKERNFTNLKPFVIPTDGVPSLLTHMVVSIEAIGAPLSNVNGWATSHWIPLRAFEQGP